MVLNFHLNGSDLYLYRPINGIPVGIQEQDNPYLLVNDMYVYLYLLIRCFARKCSFTVGSRGQVNSGLQDDCFQPDINKPLFLQNFMNEPKEVVIKNNQLVMLSKRTAKACVSFNDSCIFK